jgi:hypothetical protein
MSVSLIRLAADEYVKQSKHGLLDLFNLMETEIILAYLTGYQKALTDLKEEETKTNGS